MIFSCGPTTKVVMARHRAKFDYLTQWHPIFAWFPREVGTRDGRRICVWLQRIRRKGVWHEGDYYSRAGFRWEYRLDIRDEIREGLSNV